MKKLGVFLSLITLMLCVVSCMEDQDFDQYKDLSVVPVFESSILYLESTEDVINNVPPGPFYSQDFSFNAFSEAFFSDRVLDGVITYEIENTTSKPLSLTLEFLNDADEVLDSEPFTIDPAPSGTLQRDVVYGDTGKSLDIIRNTSRIRVVAVNEGDSTSTSNVSPPLVKFKSSGKFSLRIK
ncbi:hypothetical protein [uncultured Maribacter sp.]|uniref:hypothetical protein n=1 Tax=uncultured Maribacter sp. TaxID=431308 RepID=UPI002620B260|nr:hypothetical protein [uncultured Maribacter sp.]